MINKYVCLHMWEFECKCPKSNLKVPFHECKQSGVTCSYLEMLPLENCMSPSSPISPITNHHEFNGSKKQELGSFNLEGRSLTTRCQQEHTPSKCSRRDSFLASSGFWWLYVVLCLWLHTLTSSSIEKTSQGLPGEEANASHLCVS